MSRHRLVLIGGGAENDAPSQVLKEYEGGTFVSAMRAEARSVFAPQHPGQVIALEHEEHLIGVGAARWTRFEWYREGGWSEGRRPEGLTAPGPVRKARKRR
jgi:hypothetical protein